MMLSPSDLVAPLQLIAKLVDDMEECNELCAHVHTRLVVINDKLLAMEEQKMLPLDVVVRDYSSLVIDFQALLTRHKNRPWVYRVVSSSRMITKAKHYQERINTIMLALNMIHIGAAADERAVMECFRAEQERVIAALLARLTDDATVTKAVARHEQQFEAQNVLMLELRKTDDEPSAATSPETDADPVAAAANRRLLTTALNKVIRRSAVQVREVPVWFCTPQDVEYDAASFACGSFGSVHHGRMHHMDVVVKCLLMDTRTNSSVTKQFRDEASLWFNFRHSHVLLMYSACDVSSPPFIVCEYAKNGNLFDFLSHEHNKTHTFRLLHEAARGLAYLHANRVVHGDLKGDNILVSADMRAKIADFSFSYVRSLSASRHSTANGASAGKSAGAIRWRAPECLSGRSPTSASDVYSFGMCILEVVSQVAPWGHRVINEMVPFFVMSGKLPERPPVVTDRVWDLVTRMCKFEPSHRPSLDSVISELSELSIETELSELAMDSELAAEYAPVQNNSTSTVVATTVNSDGDDTTSMFAATVTPIVTVSTQATAVSTGVASKSISGSDKSTGFDASDTAHDALSATWTPKTLEQAITQDDVARVLAMLSSAASINAFVDGWDAPPLFVAAATGATKVAEMLLARGADLNVLEIRANTANKLAQLMGNDNGVTALHVAAQAGHVSIVKVLLAANPELISIHTLKWATTALHFAVIGGHITVIEELLRRGSCIEEQDRDSWTPLIYSALYGRVECVRFLLRRKADVHATTSTGKTTLQVAAEFGRTTIIDVLLAAGATVTREDFRVARKNKHGETMKKLERLAPPSRWSEMFG